jgi:hypothetical protein
MCIMYETFCGMSLLVSLSGALFCTSMYYVLVLVGPSESYNNMCVASVLRPVNVTVPGERA